MASPNPKQQPEDQRAEVKRVKSEVLAQAVRYTAMATQLPFTVIAGYGVGYGLDYLLGTTWLKIACLILAIVGAFWQMIRQVLKDQATRK